MGSLIKSATELLKITHLKTLYYCGLRKNTCNAQLLPFMSRPINNQKSILKPSLIRSSKHLLIVPLYTVDFIPKSTYTILLQVRLLFFGFKNDGKNEFEFYMY